VAAGRLDKIANEDRAKQESSITVVPTAITQEYELKQENGVILRKKQKFLSQLKLLQVSRQCREGKGHN
jgi:hypothetical protein